MVIEVVGLCYNCCDVYFLKTDEKCSKRRCIELCQGCNGDWAIAKRVKCKKESGQETECHIVVVS